MKISNIIRGGVLMVGAAVLMTAPAFGAACQAGEQTGDYSGVFIGSTRDEANYPVKCGATIRLSGNDEPQVMYGKSSADCARAASLSANPDGCDAADLNTIVQSIINTVIFVVGIVAVIMVILGGVQYTTSQGDAGKVKKAKDTIMYGIIGLVVAILAFAIVNFVLSSVFSGQ